MGVRSISKIVFFIIAVATLACVHRKSKTKDDGLIADLKWFKVICTHICNEAKGQTVDIEKLKMYNVATPYDITQTEDSDSIRISFDFVNPCCLDFDGDVSLDFDTLTLKYFIPPGDSALVPCDCMCDYRMTYRILKVGRSWNYFKIVSGRDG